MGRCLNQAVNAEWLSEKLGIKLIGVNNVIDRVDAADAAGVNSLCFATSEKWVRQSSAAGLIICEPKHLTDIAASALLTNNPRLDFARALALIESTVGFMWKSEAAFVHHTAQIGSHSVISPGVRIGAHTIIGHHVVIGPEVEIGERCQIKSGAIIGEPGFGFERDENGVPIRLAHIGTVRIGNDVEIGSLNTVCRGTLGDTVISNGVKTDDHVHIAHNCKIGENAILTACVELSGSVSLGRGVWVAPSTTVLNQVTIGDGATLGIGSVVVRNVDAGVTVFGNPARVISKAD